MPEPNIVSCFFLASDRTYFPYACLAALRAIELSSRPMAGFILHVGTTEEDRAIATKLLGANVGLVDVSHLLHGLAYRYDARITKASYLRLFADLVQEFEPYSRVIYLDCDVLCNRDPSDLASIDLAAPLLAAHDLTAYYDLGYRDRLPVRPGAPYFNAGVLVFDMPAVREASLLEMARHFAESHPESCVQHDQDALNVAFEGRWQTLHPLWNSMTNLHWMPPFSETFARHFSGKKPWAKDRLGVEPEAIAIYRRLSAGTKWADQFQQPSRWTNLTLALKDFERTANAALAHLGTDQRRLRRARFNKKLSLIWEQLSLDAANCLKARSFPESEFGLV
jgi:lipopolysaccharide biosynthesis glycosyltransferase